MTNRRFYPMFLGLALVMLLPITAVLGAGGDSDGSSADGLDPIREIIAEGDYVQAIGELESMDKEDPDNANVLNLLGYSHRKQGNADEAFRYYDAALQLEPKHRGANEYLGELYLETDQLGKAEERLAVLDKECFFPCEEFTDLKAAIKEYKTQRGVE